MNKLIAALAAGLLAVSTSAAIAADAPAKAPAADAKTAKALERPANVKPEDWAKMSDVDKQKAVEAANKAKSASSTSASKDAPKAKEKKGGC